MWLAFVIHNSTPFFKVLWRSLEMIVTANALICFHLSDMFVLDDRLPGTFDGGDGRRPRGEMSI